MRGTGPVSVHGMTAYGYFTEHAGRVRVRLGIDDWERLGLCEGQRVAVALPGRAAAVVMVLAVQQDPPVVWVEFAAAMARVAERAG